METDGDDGALQRPDSLGFGDFSNGFGQALAVMALARTAGGVPPAAVDFLLDQQCSGGSFRCTVDYIVFDPFGGCDTHTCDDPAEGDPDATGFALQALVDAPSSTCGRRGAVADAVVLLGQQQNVRRRLRRGER